MPLGYARDRKIGRMCRQTGGAWILGFSFSSLPTVSKACTDCQDEARDYD